MIQEKRTESASERKLKTFNDVDFELENLNESSEFDYVLIHKDQLPYFLTWSVCTLYQSTSNYYTFLSFKRFAGKICIKCDDCGEIMSEFHTSPRVDDSTRKPFQVNKNIVESTIMIDLGYGAWLCSAFV